MISASMGFLEASGTIALPENWCPRVGGVIPAILGMMSQSRMRFFIVNCEEQVTIEQLILEYFR